MSLPYHLPHLTDRESVADTVYRASEAFDANDFDMLRSACLDTMSFEIDGRVMKGLDEVRTQSFTHVGAMDTLHLVTNVRVYLEGDEAKVTANALAQHYPAGMGLEPGERRLLVGVRYFVDLVRGKEGWRIAKFVITSVWREGDASVMKH